MKTAFKLLSATAMLATMASLTSCQKASEGDIIGRNEITLASDTLTPEALWAMGRIGSYAASPDGKLVAYQVTYYDVEQDNSRTGIFVLDLQAETPKPQGGWKGAAPAWMDNNRLAFVLEGEVWSMNADGTNRQQLTHTDGAVEGFLLSPDAQKAILVKSIPFHDIIEARPADLPKTTGRVINDLMYRHWDHYVETIPHPFLTDFASGEETDILEGLPFECPMEPFGGVEQLAWSPDGKSIAYTCRAKTGRDYSTSTDADIYLYDIAKGEARNLCKAEGYEAPQCDPTKTLKHQAVNATENLINNPGYDQNPQFSPDGNYVAWLSMARDGYESDRSRICVFDLRTGEKRYVTEDFDSSVDAFTWGADSYTLYYIGVWHATENLYRTNLDGKVAQLTNEQADWGSMSAPLPAPQGGQDAVRLVMERHDYFHPADLYMVSVTSDSVATSTQLTHENDHILSQLAQGSSEARWCKTTDGLDLHYWVIKPPHFDPSKKYPTLLFCEGGPQSPVSQFWSYRWNFFIMASQGYVVIAPNRRGLPGFGQEWLEEISGDWTGQCMRDYLSAIDDACAQLPYVDSNRLGCVGASFGGFSAYYLAGHHEGRFKCFIAHDGAFNLEAMYTETEENWFSNWEYEDAYWNSDRSANADRTYRNSPHLFVEKWDTPILCIHGEKDYRINATQGMSAFNAARMKGIEAQLLLYPDENHWVLKPQNGILWQRTYFNWLARWLQH